MKKFGDKVKEAREILDLSQDQLAEKVGVSQRSITAYETDSAKPRGTTARKLARALNVSLDYLLSDDVDDPIDRVGAPDGSARPPDHLDAFDVLQQRVLNMPHHP